MLLANDIAKRGVPVLWMAEVFRQAAHRRLITDEGLMPETPAREAGSGFYFIDRAAVTALDLFSTSANSSTLNLSIWVTTELSVRVTITWRPDFARSQ